MIQVSTERTCNVKWCQKGVTANSICELHRQLNERLWFSAVPQDDLNMSYSSANATAVKFIDGHCKEITVSTTKSKYEEHCNPGTWTRSSA